MEVFIHDYAKKFLEEIDKKIQSFRKDHIKKLAENPYSKQLDIRKLKGRQNKPDLFRFRVGDYRIIYFTEENKICITEITRRERAYDF